MAAKKTNKKTNKKTKKRRVTIRKVINSIKKKGGSPSSDTSSDTSSKDYYINLSNDDFTQQDVNEEFLIDTFVTLSGKPRIDIIQYSKRVNGQIKADFENFLKKSSSPDIQIKIHNLIQENSVIDFIADVAKLPDE